MILTGEYVSDIILMIQSNFQGQKIDLKVTFAKTCFSQIQVGTSVLFGVILTAANVYFIISVIQGHLLCVNNLSLLGFQNGRRQNGKVKQ